MLIAKVKEYRPLVGKVGSLKNKSQMWNKISQDLTACGHEVNTSQVQAKYFNLERQYKKVQLHNSKTGRNRLTCPYQSELDELLLEKKKSINPEYVLDNEADVSADDFSNNDFTNSSEADKFDSTPSKSKKKKTSLQEYMEKVEDHMKKKEENDIKLMEVIEKSIKNREERAERKSAAIGNSGKFVENVENLHSEYYSFWLLYIYMYVVFVSSFSYTYI
ncbi:uncharacterized protein [Musca autumnalis]|uniref:uncharacterized protein n=1 Tax=Musca autumnalis TaxID=221902 RepID=UPI003CF4CCDF